MNKMMKEMKNGVFNYMDDTYNFDFKTSLSAYEKMMFVNIVTNTIVSDKSYDVVIKDLIFDFTIVDMFTNVDTSFINMKDGEEKDVNPIIMIEHFLDSSNVVDVVKANMESGLLDELRHAVDLNIQYLTGINQNSVGETFANLLLTIEKKIGEIDLDSMMGMVQKFSNMNEDFTIENLVNAYMNSDAHKKNLEEIAEAKTKE